MGDSEVLKTLALLISRIPVIRTVDDLLSSFDEMTNTQAETSDILTDCMRKLRAQSQMNATSMCEIVTRVESCEDKLSWVTTENKFLKIKAAIMEFKLEQYERNKRRNCIEIHGVPETSDESLEVLLRIVRMIGVRLQFIICDWMIDYCHRIKTHSNKPALIFLRFVRFIDKEEILARIRTKKRFSTLDIGLPVDQQIYVLEALTPERLRN
ncbi:hypothetical protein J6590_101738 [Homalodisca vitripennis]|nr:hypothetical protein J6590_101738 [Homalodisca vitripennis]